MKVSELQFSYPEELVAVEPTRPSRVMWVVGNSEPAELSLSALLDRIPAGDLLVINNTKVLKRRIFCDGLEILFLTSADQRHWEVLFPSRKFSVGDEITLPLGRKMKLVEKGRPQRVLIEGPPLTEDYFLEVAELPLPPYIQKARGFRHTVKSDETWYQTAWAKTAGSLAAPTASLHFSATDLDYLRGRQVRVLELTLHVGLGTFLPVSAEDLDHHDMHEEFYEIPTDVWQEVNQGRASGHKVWALGTTACRALESAADGKLTGFTRLLLQPGSKFRVVDRLLTNFHQPESTLLALVFAFAGISQVKRAYEWAIERKFRLFSYGDLSAWILPPK
jgi:S-adenosylmethionine:tRNA ribosyltransferase-isomerase